ncbi:hypothetical protein G6011_03637 [Alternaria panax]|uniref:Gfd2/YDR514C-like C-terminal domain-containing protein n=1 Tax=Alternaria panax TaxID=48097 RepID=A0AAD4IF19_9PLEO|nr:hypothetical protein G6011_03637 [Alternaria panax]
MPEHDAFSTRLHGQAEFEKHEDVGCNHGWWHMNEQNDLARIDGCLSDFEKAFLDDMDRRDIEGKDEQAKLEVLQETYEQTIAYTRTSLGIQIQNLTAETQGPPATIENREKLFVDFRREHATEIGTLLRMKERLEKDVNTKLKEIAAVHDLHRVQIKRLIGEVVALQSKLNKAVMKKSAAPLPSPHKNPSQRIARCSQYYKTSQINGQLLTVSLKMRPMSMSAKKWSKLASAAMYSRAASTKASPKVSTSPTSKSDFAAKTVRVEVPKAAKNGLQQLHKIFDPRPSHAAESDLSDAVLIAVDFENTQAIKGALTVDANCQAGIAILDTKNIKQRHIDKVLRTYMFATGTPAYVAKASNRYHFGKTNSASPSKLVNCIRSLVPPDRKVVFVGHGVMNDLRALQALGFQFSDNLVAVIDTLQVANEVFDCWAGPLRGLLKELDCPHSRLHCAGNDANFTLKALLLLTAKDLEKQDGDKGMIRLLRQFGRQELPRRLYSEVRVKPKRDEGGTSINAMTPGVTERAEKTSTDDRDYAHKFPLCMVLPGRPILELYPENNPMLTFKEESE